MQKAILPVWSVIATALLLCSCNPECESFSADNIQIPVGPFQADAEMLITATPSNFLQGRTISIVGIGASANDREELESRFVEELGGAVVTLPAEVNSNVTFFLDDPDCSSSVIPIGNPTNIVDESFFFNNPFFITPTPPLIIIPTTPPAVPPAIVNAWFSPNNRDYCIWFGPTLDTLDNGTVVELPTLIPKGDPRGVVFPTGGSVELAAGCDGIIERADRLYHDNPVSGIIDRENNFIRIQIDRTGKGLDIEEFEGQFIDPSQLPDPSYRIGGACSDDSSSQPNIMFLTSVQTGRQLILFRNLD